MSRNDQSAYSISSLRLFSRLIFRICCKSTWSYSPTTNRPELKRFILVSPPPRSHGAPSRSSDRYHPSNHEFCHTRWSNRITLHLKALRSVADRYSAPAFLITCSHVVSESSKCSYRHHRAPLLRSFFKIASIDVVRRR